MDKEKKLLHELLAADGIEPADPTKSERVAFGKLLDEQLKTKPSKPDTIRPKIWRIIMKSPVTRVAAVFVLAVGIVLTSWHHSENPQSPLSFLNLVNTACAAEQALFTGSSIVHRGLETG